MASINWLVRVSFAVFLPIADSLAPKRQSLLLALSAGNLPMMKRIGLFRSNCMLHLNLSMVLKSSLGQYYLEQSHSDRTRISKTLQEKQEKVFQDN